MAPEYIQAPGKSAVEELDQRVEPPRRFRVLMHNDNYTTMDFVVVMLRSIFKRSPGDAERIMLNIHIGGIGVCGVYPAEIAETKIEEVHGRARERGFPLRCSMEPE